MSTALVLFIMTWVLVLIGWFFPGAFKVVGAALYALGEACEDLRDVFDRQFKAHCAKGLRPAEYSPVTKVVKTAQVKAVKTVMAPVAPVVPADPLYLDLSSALVNQGVPAGKAKIAARKAIEAGNTEFSAAFLAAVGFAR